MSSMIDTKGPYVVWHNNGYEGWSPRSFDTLKEALESPKYTTEWVITKIINYEIVEK